MIDAAAAPGTPFSTDAANNPGACDQVSRPRASKGENEICQFQLGRIAKLWNGGFVLLDLQDCEISTGVSASELRINALSIGQQDFDFVFAPNRMFGSDNNAFAPINTAGWDSSPRKNCHH